MAIAQPANTQPLERRKTMPVVNDIERPDVNGIKPKMHKIESLCFAEVYGLAPHLRITCDDNLLSNIWIVGSFNDRGSWVNGIFENSDYFFFSITTEKDRRYYNEGDLVTVELTRKSYKIAAKFRKYTGTPEKAIAKIKQWILDNR